ncbi:hypothetical protein EZS27_032568, partial [termite gut metagenome]
MHGLSLKEQRKLLEQIDCGNKKHDNRQRLKWVAGIAASIALFIVAGQYLLSPNTPLETDYAEVMKPYEQDTADSDNIQLLLSGDRKISIDGKETQVDYRKEGQVKINKDVEVKEDNAAQNKETVFNQLIVPLGKRSTITFKDGTKVWINSGSRIMYPVNFGKDKREIYAEGEIYPDVTHDVSRPFIVKTKKMEIKVLGTEFNITAYENESDWQVILVNGKVTSIPQEKKELTAEEKALQTIHDLMSGKLNANDYNRICEKA